ncbi:conjugal transfer pilus assembly protein TraE [Grimontella sp. AG753]|nr:conjugal transfer pilus assembly protein TraE [Grimontella sp. AG753]
MFNKPKSRPVKKEVTEALNDNQKKVSDAKFNRAALIACVIISGITYQKVDKLENKQTTVIVPYGAKSSDMLITGESASAGYMRMILRLIISDYGSVSKATVDNKFSDLLSLVYIDRNEAMRVKLNERSKYFKQFNTISQVMELLPEQDITIKDNPPDVQYSTAAKNKYRIEFSVEQRKIIGEDAKPTETQKMHIDYTISQGRFWILDIQG